jgi:hypothetical protein
VPIIEDQGVTTFDEPAKLDGKPRGKHRRDQPVQAPTESPLGGRQMGSVEPVFSVPTPQTAVDSPRRIKSLTPRVQQAMPATTAWLAAKAQMDPYDLARTAEGLDKITAWTDQENSFAGQPGGLSLMRQRAMAIEDPVVRQEALDFITNLKLLPPDQQQAFILMQQTGTVTEAGLEAAAAVVEQAFATGAEARAATTKVTTDEGVITSPGRPGMNIATEGEVPTVSTEAHLELAGADTSIDIKTMLMQMFPTLAAQIGPNLDDWEQLDDFLQTPVEPNGIAQWIYDKSGSVRNITDIESDVNEGKRTIASSILPLAGSGLGVGFDLTTAAIGAGGRGIGAEGIVADVGGIAKQATEVLSETFTGWAESGFRIETFGGVGFNIMGEIDPTDPDYNWKIQQRLGAFGLITMGLGGTLGPIVGRRLKIARSVPGKEAAASILEATRSVRRGGILGSISEIVKTPIRELTKQLDNQLVKFARDPEEFWKAGLRTKQGAKIVQVLEEAKRLHPDDINGQLGFVAEVYGTGVISPKLARVMLEQVDPAGMKRAFVDFLTNTPGKVAITELRNSKRALTKRIAKLEEAGPSNPKLDLSPEEVKGLLPVVQYPARTVTDATGGMRGRTVEQVAALRKSLKEKGYDPTHIPEGGTEPIGPLQIYFDPATGKAVMMEGHHRLGLLAEENLGAPIEIKVNRPLAPMSPEAELASLGGGGLPEQDFKALPPELQARIAEAVKVADDPGVELDRLALELDQIDWKMKTTQTDRPMLKYPTRSHIRAMVRAPVTRFEKTFHFVFENRVWDAAKLVDELPKYPELFVTGGSHYPADGLERNVDTLSRYMRQAGVSAKVIQERIGELVGTKSQRSFYTLVEEKIFGKGGDIDRALKSTVSPEIRDRIINLHTNPIEGRTRSMVHETATTATGSHRVSRPVLAKEVRPGEFVPEPSRPSEFLNTLRLPDVDLLHDADSAIRRTVARVRSGSLKGRLAVEALYDLPKAILGLSTAILKPLVMLVRLPAMAMRIQMEQSLRISSLGYRPFKGIPNGLSILPGGIPVPFTHGKARVLSGLFGEDGWNMLAPDPRFAGYMEPNASETGMFMTELMDGGGNVTVPQSTLDFRTGRRVPDRKAYEGWRQELQIAHEDFLDHQIAISNFDIEKVKQWMTTDFRAGEYMSRDQIPGLQEAADRAGITLEQQVDNWLNERVTYLKQMTHENPELIEAIKTGRLREYDSIRPQKLPNGRLAADRYNEVLAKTKLISEDIRYRNKNGFPEGSGPGYDVRANAAEMAALQVERRRGLQEAARLREEFPDLERGAKTFDLADKRASRAALKRRWEKAEWEMPETISVDHRLRESQGDTGLADDINRYGQAVSTQMYKPFRALSWVDRKGTRGSLFAQAYLRRKGVLEKLGYSPEEAVAFARVHAGEVTRDIMYDLSARTSAQRALKNVFWFAPAWQEVLYTWAVKIPAESYWPIGALGLVAKYKGITFALREVGVLKKDAEGNDIIMVPGMAGLIERITGLKVPEITYGKLSGLNLVSTGGGVPGLSTAGNFLLGKAALKYGGPFKAISDVFQPYGPEASILPTPITYLHEAVFGEPAPWEFMSPELQKSRWDQTFDTGIQYAFAELKEAGTVPPLPEDFGTVQKDGTVTLSAAQEVKYRQASDDYLHELMDLGERYARGMATVKLIGGTIAPMSLYSTTTARDEWKEFFASAIAAEGFGSQGLSDHQKQLMEDYLAEHPESTAFAVFQSEYGDKQRDLPFGESLDDAYFDDYYTGARRTMDPRDYSLKVMAIESLRHYQSRTDKVLDKISPSRDPWALLTSGFERTSAIQAEKEAWDRYLFLNPEADALLTRQRAAWIRAKGDEPGVPVRSFEAERLGNTIDALKQISDQITGEAPVRPDELKTILADLQEMYSVHSEEFGKPNTPTEKAMGWWFDNVLQPYLDRTSELYKLAQEAEARGLSPAPYYNEIRAFQNSSTPNYKGAETPSVESVFFGNKSPVEQKATVMKWRTRPLSWLSNYQLEKVGVTDPTVVDFLNVVSAYDEQFWNYVNQNGITGDDLDYYREQRSKTLAAAAAQAGPAAAEAFAMNEAEPYVRLTASGFGQDSSLWASATGVAGQIIQRLEAADLSPRGFSEDALRYKTYLYTSIEQARASDQGFDELWNKLSDIMILPNGVPREGALLYEAVLFGNFNDQVPYALASIGG